MNLDLWTGLTGSSQKPVMALTCTNFLTFWCLFHEIDHRQACHRVFRQIGSWQDDGRESTAEGL